jgi:hypothetical protein
MTAVRADTAATGARPPGAGRAVAGESEGTEVIPNTIPGGSMVYFSRCLTSPIQQETPVLADGGFSNPSKGRDPMHELYLSYDSTIQIANPIPLVLMNSGVICVKAVL